jgi:hypothetical protein
MFIAVAAYRTNAITKAGEKWNVVCGQIGETPELAGGLCEKALGNSRASYPAYDYRTFIAEVTHETVPPEESVKIRAIKAI